MAEEKLNIIVNRLVDDLNYIYDNLDDLLNHLNVEFNGREGGFGVKSIEYDRFKIVEIKEDAYQIKFEDNPDFIKIVEDYEEETIDYSTIKSLDEYYDRMKKIHDYKRTKDEEIALKISLIFNSIELSKWEELGADL